MNPAPPKPPKRPRTLPAVIGSLAAALIVSAYIWLRPSAEKPLAPSQAQGEAVAAASDAHAAPSLHSAASLASTRAHAHSAQATPAKHHGTIRFNRDIRPILSDNCFHCHGPDKYTREADLRLDTHEGILSTLSGGRRTVIPGDPENSEFYKRLITTEADMIMPPPNSHKHLKPDQIALFRDWIAQGAHWEDHWSFTPIKRPAVPTVANAAKVHNPIDAFILRKIEENGLTPNEEADRHTLVRRVSLDTRGLPPTAEEVIAFVDDPAPDAYEQMVDRFLADSKFGEHRARYWLDAARYSDTHGYHMDNYRSIWPYRDWVTQAFNDNMPFDQFTIEQIAGDMLPEATQSQLVATGFNRCNPTTGEGGVIAEEYFAIYALDRVEATTTAWLGLTMSCASCHDHKFDPLSQKEFYQMAAFFRNTTQPAMDNNAHDTPPSIYVYSPEHKVERAELQPITQQAERDLLPLIGNYAAAQPKSRDAFEWIADEALSLHSATEDTGVLIDPSTRREIGDQVQLQIGSPFTISFWVLAPKNDTQPLTLFGRYDPQSKDQGWQVRLETDASVSMLLVTDEQENVKFSSRAKLQAGEWNHVLIAYDGISNIDRAVTSYNSSFSIRVNNSAAQQKGLKRENTLNGSIETKQPFVIGSAKPGDKVEGNQATLKDLRIFNTLLCVPEQELLALTMPSKHINLSKPAEKAQAGFQLDIASIKPRLQAARVAVNRLQQIQNASPITLIMEEKKDSKPFAHILERGDYASRGERVIAGVPAVLPPLEPGVEANRLALANWLVNPENPLPARVATNRFWLELFGTGIVSTPEDFGSQGVPPSHIELLDWLAAEFIDSEWNIKHMYKLMLMSSTYRQSTRITEEELNSDPDNVLLARGPRYRLDAEVIRDQALFISGLMNDQQVGGHPVKPYQPNGLWNAVAYTRSNTAKFQADMGQKLYRRSLYTFWKRTAPPPSMSIFDAPTRESCSVRRERTNTPLQALVLMNDPQFVEAARHLATVTLKAEREDRFAALYARALGNEPDQQQLAILKNTYQQVLPTYIENPALAEQLLAVGDSPADDSLDPAVLAAWTVVANQVMNLDALITKN